MNGTPTPIARRWTARATPVNTQRYLAIARDQVLPALRTLPGFRGGAVLTRPSPSGETDIEFITFWESLDAIRAFAGQDIARAVILPEAEALLSHADHAATHWQVVLQESTPPHHTQVPADPR
jgi:heme-degrading monooxygenase HmoA